MKKLIALILPLLIVGCANHPVDCAIGIPWADCLEGTQGYINGVGKRINEQEVESEIIESELEKLKALHDKGLIDDELYQEKQRELLDL